METWIAPKFYDFEMICMRIRGTYVSISNFIDFVVWQEVKGLGLPVPLRNVLNYLLGTSISPPKGKFEDDFPFPQVRYFSSLGG